MAFSTDDLFGAKLLFDNLEIETADNISIYVSRWWLSTISRYFNKLLNSGFSESSSTKIKLLCKSSTLKIIFGCVLKGYLGEKYLDDTYLKKINNIDDIYDLVAACNEYQLDTLKNLCDKSFSDPKTMDTLFGYKLLHMVGLFKMLIMKKTLVNDSSFDKKMDFINSLDYSTMTANDLDLITPSWSIFIPAFEIWTITHDPTDEELKKSGICNYEFNTLPKKYIPNLYQILKRLKNPIMFKISVYEDLISIN